MSCAGGGALKVSTMDVSDPQGGAARLATEGGELTVLSLEGNADLSSGGGAVHVSGWVAPMRTPRSVERGRQLFMLERLLFVHRPSVASAGAPARARGNGARGRRRRRGRAGGGEPAQQRAGARAWRGGQARGLPGADGPGRRGRCVSCYLACIGHSLWLRERAPLLTTRHRSPARRGERRVAFLHVHPFADRHWPARQVGMVEGPPGPGDIRCCVRLNPRARVLRMPRVTAGAARRCPPPRARRRSRRGPGPWSCVAWAGRTRSLRRRSGQARTGLHDDHAPSLAARRFRVHGNLAQRSRIVQTSM